MRSPVLGVTATIGGALAIATIAYQLGSADGLADLELQFIDTSNAAEEPLEISPVKARERDSYAPNSEELAPDDKDIMATFLQGGTDYASQPDGSNPQAVYRRCPREPCCRDQFP